ncbi:MAG: sulfatase-like hydrolase/transferase [Eubacterium sp.]|nr:sulfatase-like hydrolase/transferase [Eubacterium sp.]
MENDKKSIIRRILNNSIVMCFLVAFLIELIAETLGRQQTPGLGGLQFMVSHPVVFFYNVLLIFATLSISILFRRRAFMMALIALPWMAIAVTNGVILMQRMTPFTMKDLSAMTEGMTILTNYMSVGEIAGIVAVLVLLIAAFVVLLIKGPRVAHPASLRKRLAAVVLIFVCTFGATVGLVRLNVLSTFFGNLAYAYRDYGVQYCFVNTWLNTGIRKPSGYSEEAVQKIIRDAGISKSGVVKLEQKEKEMTKPNILFLQLESFVDPTLFNKFKYSDDPIPYYRSLMKKYSSGSLTVPACGAGTANTEFETMTGISVKFFGPGEYPFKAILKDEPAESAASDLKLQGYSTHAIHNHRALFYNRNTVFDNIGYDTFTSVEYMSGVTYTPKNWARDELLTSQIMDAMKSSKERDYIYTISVQGHGKYPSEKLIAHPNIRVTKAPNDEMRNQYEYYANQVNEMDTFVKELTETLAAFDEPVILVMYGDHIPALDISEEDYDAKDLYQTQYIIWSNYPMSRKEKDLTSYQLMAEVMDRLDIHTGTTFRFHQNVKHNSESYLTDLKTLSYDILYGKFYAYGGSNPWKPAGMKMGVKEIRISKVVNVGGKYYIKGKNFTERSKITLDGETLNTTYLSPSLLGLDEEVDPNDAARMKVSQIDKNSKSIISTTE